MKTKNDLPSISKRDCSHIREPLQNKEITLEFIDRYIDEMCREIGASDDRYGDWLKILYRNNVELVYRFCESPIEILLMNSLQFHGLSCGLYLSVISPVEDFREWTEAYEHKMRKTYECHRFYKSIPEDARPSTFADFLGHWEDSGDLTSGESKDIQDDVLLGCEMGMMHMPLVALQPSIPKFLNGKTIRPDAIIFVPSNPKVKVVVECDGMETHQAKEVFVSDRKRDRLLFENGFQVRRYSGSEIWNDPPASSKDLMDFLKSAFTIGIQQKKRWEKAMDAKVKPPSESVIASWRKVKAGQNGENS